MTNLQKELKEVQNLWEMAYDTWESLKGRDKKLFEESEMNSLRVKMYNLKQRIAAGETGEDQKQKELEKLQKQYNQAVDVYITLKGKKRLAWQVNELDPLNARIYNLKKELNK